MSQIWTSRQGLGTVRTDLHNQSRVKGLRQLQAGHCASVFCFACIGRLFRTNFLCDDRYFTMAGGSDGEVGHRGLQSRIFNLTEPGEASKIVVRFLGLG